MSGGAIHPDDRRRSPLPFPVPRPGAQVPPNSTIDGIALALRDVSQRIQRRLLCLVNDIADAEARGEVIAELHVVTGPPEDRE